MGGMLNRLLDYKRKPRPAWRLKCRSTPADNRLVRETSADECAGGGAVLPCLRAKSAGKRALGGDVSGKETVRLPRRGFPGKFSINPEILFSNRSGLKIFMIGFPNKAIL